MICIPLTLLLIISLLIWIDRLVMRVWRSVA